MNLLIKVLIAAILCVGFAAATEAAPPINKIKRMHHIRHERLRHHILHQHHHPKTVIIVH